MTSKPPLDWEKECKEWQEKAIHFEGEAAYYKKRLDQEIEIGRQRIKELSRKNEMLTSVVEQIEREKEKEKEKRDKEREKERDRELEKKLSKKEEKTEKPEKPEKPEKEPNQKRRRSASRSKSRKKK